MDWHCRLLVLHLRQEHQQHLCPHKGTDNIQHAGGVLHA